MARRLETNDEIDEFIGKVIGEAEDHAPQVEAVIQPLSDAVRKRIDLNRDKVEVFERDGNLARTCWVTIEGKRYVFSYEYDGGRIVAKHRSTHGQPFANFDNSTSPDVIASFAGGL